MAKDGTTFRALQVQTGRQPGARAQDCRRVTLGQKMLRLIERCATWPIFILFAVVAGGLRWVLGVLEQGFTRSVGRPTLPDFAIGTHDLYDHAIGYSDHAISVYLGQIAPLDILFPAVLAVFLATGIRLFGGSGIWVRVALAAMVIDWGENIGIVGVIHTIDNPVAGLGVLTSALTKVKFAAYSAAFLALIVCAARRLMSQKR